ncbi:glycosyl hydrolase family 28-related protein [Nitrosovibrio sp. Nv4]|uniref:glycosyl hydrolase family 28-related protein n=1 Tax=Nitrosovibrio sp. Nv4 TaxID=1945880 RepID=UPI000BDB8C38|nr:glycosyl hydrolase family 28-related protein [Nitrosovibrio sp. Nv4]SOD41309.1 Pectate lyase superfamily protein [Nitrosovibrio sp. Nv4]
MKLGLIDIPAANAANNAAIQVAIENTLSRDGTGPNQMGANLDMGGFAILNCPSLTPSSGGATVSVKDAAFGAVGDGVTDDAAAINAAIAHVKSTGGGEVFIPRGTYRIGATIRYLAGVSIIGESMASTTLLWFPSDSAGGVMLDTSNESLHRVTFRELHFTKDVSVTTPVTGILGGSTLTNYNSAVGFFENLLFAKLKYGIRGNAEPTGVGIFDCHFRNIWCTSCFYGLQLFGSGNRIEQPRMTYCDTGIVLDYLNPESYDGHTISGGVFVKNNYDFGIPTASGIRPTVITGTWFEQSTYGIINIINMDTRVMNLSFIGCQLSTSCVDSLFNVWGALGTISVDKCTLISGGVGTAQNFVAPSSANGRLLVTNCQKYDSAGVGSFL